MSWNPIEPGLFQLPDTAVNLDYLIYHQVEEGETVLSYTWSISPADPNPFTISVDGGGVRLQAASLSGLFKPNFLDYRDGDQVLRASDWSEIPPCKDLVEFKPSSVSQLDYTITVTVMVKATDPFTSQSVEAKYTNSWTMVILHDYSSGKQKLLEYMRCQL
ncbi:hypothetical protein [Photobacterium galatheae]|uniref:BCTnown n=1 Tax=Photobacterium galatheae TaxID=1654360 RepID=A0A066RYX8_9GAMM|nr:hypothetical protein [Photobacterium galatheae]KDM92897.1 hypothetical protein EA58_03840 [Photobacterium galatheae]MCM0148138.1 hypothetical protein [Photobacterium galatheae]